MFRCPRTNRPEAATSGCPSCLRTWTPRPETWPPKPAGPKWRPSMLAAAWTHASRSAVTIPSAFPPTAGRSGTAVAARSTAEINVPRDSCALWPRGSAGAPQPAGASLATTGRPAGIVAISGMAVAGRCTVGPTAAGPAGFARTTSALAGHPRVSCSPARHPRKACAGWLQTAAAASWTVVLLAPPAGFARQPTDALAGRIACPRRAPVPPESSTAGPSATAAVAGSSVPALVRQARSPAETTSASRPPAAPRSAACLRMAAAIAGSSVTVVVARRIAARLAPMARPAAASAPTSVEWERPSRRPPPRSFPCPRRPCRVGSTQCRRRHPPAHRRRPRRSPDVQSDTDADALEVTGTSPTTSLVTIADAGHDMDWVQPAATLAAIHTYLQGVR